MKPLLSVVARLDDKRPRTRVNKGFGFSIQFSSRGRCCVLQNSVVRNVSGSGKIASVVGAEMAGFFIQSAAADGFRIVGSGTKWVHELIAVGMTRDVCRWMALRQHRCDEETA